ncbi:MAG TPA: class E sortase [Rubrobacteraceae bacterium]|nr:class E sortase [Rubrobacteraceae bacterium]
MVLRKMVLLVAALTMVVGLAACGSSGQSGGDQGSKASDKKSEKAAPKKESDTKKSDAKKSDAKKDSGKGEKKLVAKVPKEKTLGLSIPKLGKDFKDLPTGQGDDTQMLTNNAAIHIRYPTKSGGFATGWPWKKEANVYFAGHVEGYQGTPSYKAFDGIGTLEKGDDIIVTDADGQKYTYKVSEKKIVHPTEVDVLNPVPGKNVITLQTCEIVNVDANGNPDYSNTERLIVRGELKDVEA